MDNNKNISYSGVVLDGASRAKLLAKIGNQIPEDYEVIAHHMTINLGELPQNKKNDIGKTVNLTVHSIGIDDMAMAVGVSGYPSSNEKPHITIAVNRKNGGKPFMSNKIEKWREIPPFKLQGKVEEIPWKK